MSKKEFQKLMDDIDGSYEAAGVHIEFVGACPVQGDGIIDGRDCYYRSRGSGWQFYVAPDGSSDVFSEDAFVYSENPYEWPEGGWVPAEVSAACIDRGVKAFREYMSEPAQD